MSRLSLYKSYLSTGLCSSLETVQEIFSTLCQWRLTDADLQRRNLARWCSGVQNYAEALWCARLESLFRWRGLSAAGQLWLCGTKPPEQRFITLHIFLQQAEEPTMSLSDHSSMHTAQSKPLARWLDRVWQAPGNVMPNGCLCISLTYCTVINDEIFVNVSNVLLQYLMSIGVFGKKKYIIINK